jgi:hypothetical protein
MPGPEIAGLQRPEAILCRTGPSVLVRPGYPDGHFSPGRFGFNTRWLRGTGARLLLPGELENGSDVIPLSFREERWRLRSAYERLQLVIVRFHFPLRCFRNGLCGVNSGERAALHRPISDTGIRSRDAALRDRDVVPVRDRIFP